MVARAADGSSAGRTPKAMRLDAVLRTDSRRARMLPKRGVPQDLARPRLFRPLARSLRSGSPYRSPKSRVRKSLRVGLGQCAEAGPSATGGPAPLRTLALPPDPPSNSREHAARPGGRAPLEPPPAS